MAWPRAERTNGSGTHGRAGGLSSRTESNIAFSPFYPSWVLIRDAAQVLQDAKATVVLFKSLKTFILTSLDDFIFLRLKVFNNIPYLT